MTTHTQRHTARPSRARVALARLGAWLDRHDDAVTLGAVAFIVATVSTLGAIALAVDYGVSTRDAVSVAVLMVALASLSGFFAWQVANDRATARVSRRYSRYLNETNDRHERELASVKARALGVTSVSKMSAYDMSAELARLSEREHALRYALRYSRNDGAPTSTATR